MWLNAKSLLIPYDVRRSLSWPNEKTPYSHNPKSDGKPSQKIGGHYNSEDRLSLDWDV